MPLARETTRRESEPQSDPALKEPARLALVPRLRTRTLLAMVLLLAAASFLAEIAEHVFGRESVFGLVPLVKMDEEVNLPTWFNSALLLCCAALALVIGSMKRQERDPYRWHWLGLAAALLLMSIDDTAAIHEKTNSVLLEYVNTGGVLLFPWLILGTTAVVALAVVFLPFARSLPPTTRRQLVAAFALFFGAAVGLEMVEAAYSDARGGGRDLGGGVLTTLEDAMEMSGVIVAIAALSAYIRSWYPDLRLRLGDGTLEPGQEESAPTEAQPSPSKADDPSS